MAGEYDALAWFYDRYWGPRYHDAARPVLQRLLYDGLARGDRVLDLCCGTGHLSQELVARGFRIIGIDSSLEMLRLARRRIPDSHLLCADVGAYSLSRERCAAAVSTFDSINHLLTRDQVVAAFHCTAAALRAGGLFVFDVNTDEAYRAEWGKSSAVVEPDAALFVRGGYDERTAIGRTLITMFRLDGVWHRADVELMQRPYGVGELTSALKRAGFTDIESMPADDAGMQGTIAVGRVFFRARRSD